MESGELGFIERIRVYPAKGEKGKELSEARLFENLGVEGDFHAAGGDHLKPNARQLTFMFAADESKNSAKGTGLCTARFKENITIKRCNAPFPSLCLGSGTRLAIGEAILEISAETKRCHEECPLFQAGERCSLAGKNLFANVLKGGIIHAGDRIEIIFHASAFFGHS